MASGRPTTETCITQHTLWTALTGEMPPLVLPATPIAHATLDSRDAGHGDLFVALAGASNDGHNFIRAALDNGALTVIAEERGRSEAQKASAVVDCTRGRWAIRASLPATYYPTQAITYIVDKSELAFQQLGAFQRMHRTNPALRVIGVTGSIGKTSTKELTASVMRQRYKTLASQGNMNNEQGLPLTLLGLDREIELAVLEMGMYDVGEIERLCTLARPQVGIVTMVAPVHLSRLGTIARIAQAKAELVQALPAAADGGVAILNWDDERVRAMAELTAARIFRYGMTPEADLWADDVRSMGMEGIRFRFHYRKPGTDKVESLYLRVPLLGRHSVHTALCATAAGLVEGLGWDEIVAGLQSIPGQLRLVVVPGINGSTVIDDTYNASPASTVAALNLLADIEPKGRRVAVLGDMRELGSYTGEGHKLVGARG
ncbi:MAG: UDP-N-acetylmuramoyl-tripeptide--D-alanyl-D-alanine ligase [Anaerolineales bacterium]|nr:UDP-N-acetylmuramoyl-tripeptide--D-alanyl-D-alanine ligase [Anaerolineales bacterium]